MQNYKGDGSPEGGLNSRDDSHELERFDHSSRDFEARSLDAIIVPIPRRRVAGLPPEVVDALPTPLLTEPGRTQGIFYEYFEALDVRNPGTREAYERAVRRFLEWCSDRGVAGLEYVTPIHISRYVDTLRSTLAPPTIKVHISALRKCFDQLVSEHVVATNPARSVESPRHVVRVGLTPVLDADQTRELLDSIPLDNICGVRDRAIIGTLVFTFGRVGAVVAIDVRDYHTYLDGTACSGSTRRVARRTTFQRIMPRGSTLRTTWRLPSCGNDHGSHCSSL